MAKKLTTISFIIVLLSIIGLVTVNAFDKDDYEFTQDYEYSIAPTSNFFSQPETYDLVTARVLPEDYTHVTTSNGVSLYVKEDHLSIAVKVEETGYIWFSEYQDLGDYAYTDGLNNYVKSGVTIEYYNGRTLYESKTSILDEETVLTYTYTSNGFKANIDFEELGIKFDVLVKLVDGDLVTKVLNDTITETEIELKSKKYPINNKLKSIELFPFFGSENYEIDGYSFIPDGSGALIRYEDIPNTTAFRARVYGEDTGYKNDSVLYDHMQETEHVSMPVYGVVHGVNQNAFFAEVTNGDMYSELNSYPYGYLTDFNTTFMKYVYREKYAIRFSSNEKSIAIIDEEPKQTDIETTYHFLSGDDASYIGMAHYYKDQIEFKNDTENGDIPMRLEFIGLEYKKGLFGKNYITMTSYKDVVNILKDLESDGLDNNTVVYESWNKGGFYDNAPVKPQTSSKLGGKNDFNDLVTYINESGNTLELYNDPFISFNNSFNSDLASRVTMNLFEIECDSNLFDYVYYREPNLLSDPFTDYKSDYNALGITSVALDSVGDTLFSYRADGEYYSREVSLEEIISEMTLTSDDFTVSFYKPHSYLFGMTSNYYDIAYESSRYPFMTDSVPFLQVVLSGHVEMYSEYANFISDYYIYALRLIEYGVNPSFILTAEETYNLRYTNSEHVYTSEYELWKDHIQEIYTMVNDALEHTHGEEIVDFKYIATGVSETTYSNGVKVIVNYSEETVNYDTYQVDSMGYIVIGDGQLE